MDNSDIIFGIMASLGKDEYSFAGLEYLTSPFGMTLSSLRTNLHRMTKKELIKVRKQGKKAFYGFGKRGERISRNVALGFKNPDWSHWDKTWIAAVFSVPQKQKELRYKFRKKLTAYRFAPFYPGFWIKPFHPKEKTIQALESFSETDFFSLIKFSHIKELTKEKVNELWDLEG